MWKVATLALKLVAKQADMLIKREQYALGLCLMLGSLAIGGTVLVAITHEVRGAVGQLRIPATVTRQ